MTRVRVLMATGCHLCPPVVAAVRAACAERGLVPEVVDIDGDLALERRYREAIPVVEVDGAEAFRYHATAAEIGAVIDRTSG